jgi:quercetin dioxygenase-like cupin family protein
VAVLGPFRLEPGKNYTARYMEAVFPEGMRAAIHRHVGPEAFYVLSGTQCLETPQGITITKAGEGHVIEAGAPMALSSVGAELRRSVVLVLHDPAQNWITMEKEWKPKGACPK